MNRVVGHFCDFFLDKWSNIGRFSGSERMCWDTFAIFFLDKWSNIGRFSGSERMCWDTFAIFF